MNDKIRPVTRAGYKILFITDSLAFPRMEPETVMYEDTYIALLKSEFPQCDFIHHGRGGATIVDLFKHSTYYHETLKPDLVFMQSGVVDCAPRALTVIEQQIISRLPILGPLVGAIIKRHVKNIRRWRNMTYTTPSVFANYVQRFESLYKNVYWIGILPAYSEYESSVQGIISAIDRYNAVLHRRNFISTADFTSSDIMSDYHHLNVAGHHRLAALLAKTVQRVVLD